MTKSLSAGSRRKRITKRDEMLFRDVREQPRLPASIAVGFTVPPAYLRTFKNMNGNK